MVVAPWILPLRVAVFAILIGQARLLSRSLITILAGAGITLILSMGLGLIARSQGLLVVEALPEQIVARLEPNTFDLGIALAAGALASYAKVNPGAVSSVAGTAIAVALVPPVCVMGLMLSGPDISNAQGPALLYAANLLGILIGGSRCWRFVSRTSATNSGAAAAHAYPCCWHWVWPCWWVKNCMGGMSNTDTG